ncbi:hypothetical protein CGMCC3_g7436 [Colletotrichum fructicola]|nr:uncharacterized protein CGMCC3_g7436 [Colletotrichum fructicola]KAE9576431.1 hypothetical protein CGMCC3_g7436 [Colletotrichum fructicola]
MPMLFLSINCLAQQQLLAPQFPSLPCSSQQTYYEVLKMLTALIPPPAADCCSVNLAAKMSTAYKDHCFCDTPLSLSTFEGSTSVR